MKFLFSILLVAIFTLTLVSAWSNNTFNNSLTQEELILAPNVTRYLEVPSNTVLINALMNVTYNTSTGVFLGNNLIFNSTLANANLEKRYEYSTTTASSFSCSAGNSIAQTFTVGVVGTNETFNLTRVSLTLTQRSGNTNATIEIQYVNSTNAPNGSIIVSNVTWNNSEAPADSSYKKINITLPKATLNQGQRYAIVLRWGGSGTAIKWRGQVGSSYSGGEEFYSLPNAWGNIWLAEGREFEFEVFGDKETINQATNTTSNFATTINNYLQSCSYVSGICSVPFIFHSYINGSANYSALTFNNNGFIENSITYNSTTSELSNEGFILNLTYDNNEYDINSTFIYNKTTYSTTKLDYGSNIIFYTTLQVPITVDGTLNEFYWNVNISKTGSSSLYNSTKINQTVSKLSPLVSGLNCSTGFTPSLNFTFFYEDNLTLVNVTRLDYLLQYGNSGNNSAKVINGSITNVNQFTFCINNSEPYFDVGYGELSYFAPDSVTRKYYVFTNTRITNATINIPLYNIETAIASAFTITAKTNNLVPYDDNYIGLLRWYPNLNDYKVVELGKTDSLGQTVLNIKPESVDYRLALYTRQGVLIKLLSPIRFTCSSAPCTYSIIVDSNVLDLTTFTGIQKSLTFDSTTKKFTFVWNDPTQTSQIINLSVYKLQGVNYTEVCFATSSGYTGLLTCDVSLQSGMLFARAIRSASPSMTLAELTAEIRATFIDSGGSSLGLLIGAVLLIFFALIGTISPVMVIILSIVALIPLFILGNIGLGVMMTFGVIGGIILHFLRRIA